MKRALLFAAGRGQRMQPLSLATPKPLLEVGGKPLIVWHLEKLARAGFQQVVINNSYLGSQFAPQLGDGTRWGLHIEYLDEGPEPLETGGGMRNALPWLGDEPFLGIASDIWSDLDYARLRLPADSLAHLVMVDNPEWYPSGDFYLRNGKIELDGEGQRLTFASIGVYHPRFIAGHPPGCFKLLPLYQSCAQQQRLSGEHFSGHWHNIGTPQQLDDLDQILIRSAEAS